MESDTDALRTLAPSWSLQGDTQLLGTLQAMHQRIVSKCSETELRLQEMVSVLDGAGLVLQNINNRFMSLSNRQFVESRVYDDDVTDAAPAPPPPPPEKSARATSAGVSEPRCELERCLDTLQSWHEVVTIVPDSDSDTDDDDVRMVLKPKDLYRHRPLPYVIGSQQWRSKWHCGLVGESDSDADSAEAAVERDELYSDSERSSDGRKMSPVSDRSEGSPAPPPRAPRPADVAQELARRLGGRPPTPAAEPDTPPGAEAYVPRTLYKPQQTAPALFCESPPPAPAPASPSDSEDDIFAEMLRRPREHPPPAPAPALRDTARAHPSLFQDEPQSQVFDEGTRHTHIEHNVREQDSPTKKPIGGISLFGSNKNNDSIGAAILKRNQQKSSSDDSENDSDVTEKPAVRKPEISDRENKRNEVTNVEIKKTEVAKDLFDDLFAKSENVNKKPVKLQRKVEKKETPVVKERQIDEKKVDLFSDNIFDDIDDIFTSNVITSVPRDVKNKQKSIFDDVNDDLFADLSISNTKVTTDSKSNKTTASSSKTDNKSSKKLEEISNIVTESSKSIFDSDDELFNDNFVTETKNEFKANKQDEVIPKDINKFNQNATKVSQIVKETKSLFDDDDDIFSDIKIAKINKDVTKNETKSTVYTKISIVKHNVSTPEQKVFQDDEEAFTDHNNQTLKENATVQNEDVVETPKLHINQDEVKNYDKPKSVVKSPDLFDDDADDLFINSGNKHKSILKDEILETSRSALGTAITTAADTSKVTDMVNNTSKNIRNNDELDELFEQPQESKDKVSLSKENSDKAFKQSIFNDNSNDDIFAMFLDKDTKNNPRKLESGPKKVEVNPEISEEGLSKPENIRNSIVENAQIPNIAAKPAWTENYSNQKIRKTPEPHSSAEQNASVKSTDKPVVKPTLIDNTAPNLLTIDTDRSTEVTKPNTAPRTDEKSIFDDVIESTVPKSEWIMDKKSDAVTDIFNDQPPEFEKPKEPKKSKNVNALFDDDSDDEALFFKKNDVVFDEKPEVFSQNNNEANPNILFGLFHDEPPAIDVDFTPKKIDQEVITADINELLDSDDDIFSTNLPKSNVTGKTDATANVLSLKIESKDLSENPDTIYSGNNNVIDNEIKDDSTLKARDKLSRSEDSLDSVTEPKKIGKLKPMNFNINVNTLLPGASPKKQITLKTNEQTKSNEELNSNEEITEPGLVKSISFEGGPDSKVLDNKLSKGRAKIQVKRRPSTRRARKEAVRKSGIDFGEDSTDNSSSIDDPPKALESETREILEPNSVDSRHTEATKTKEDTNVVKTTTASTNITVETNKIVTETTPLTKEFPNIMESIDKDITSKAQIDSASSPDGNDLVPKVSPSKDVKSKIVYVLNDEDIFTNVKPQKSDLNTNISETKSDVSIDSYETKHPEGKSNILGLDDDSDEDIFKSMTPSARVNEKVVTTTKVEETVVKTSEGVQTLGQMYKETTKVSQITDNDSEDDIFKDLPKTTTSKVVEEPKHVIEKTVTTIVASKETIVKPKSIFDDLSDEENELFNNQKSSTDKLIKIQAFAKSDSEDELFSGKKETKRKESTKEEVKENKKKQEEKVERKEVKVAKSLFGDEEDDDDLFGVKSKKTEKAFESHGGSAREQMTSNTRPVIEDPLSGLFNDDS